MNMKQTGVWLTLAFVLTIALSGCRGQARGPQAATGDSLLISAEEMAPRYATGYQVSDSNGVRLVDVGKDYHFALVSSDEADVPEGYTKVVVPITRTILMTML